jgi:ferric-dicitrate binding protein FerR (iron transport regulator)
VKKLDKHITAVPEWDKSAKQIWNERFEALVTDDTDDTDVIGEDTDVTKTVQLWSRIKYIVSVAAVFIILISVTAALYKKEISAQLGQTRITHLPDGSSAELSAGTSISYRPLLWMFSPCVEMKGEAYFSGRHTTDFTVKTDNGDIMALGTSFNVRNYHDKLSVACIEGKIRVANGKSSVILTANMQATTENGLIKTQHFTETEDITGWTKGVFSFNNEPLGEVLFDVERYYGVKVSTPENIDTLRYTGRFTRDKHPEDVLQIICQTYGITLKLIR